MFKELAVTAALFFGAGGVPAEVEARTSCKTKTCHERVFKARLTNSGRAKAPVGAPPKVRRIIKAANKIAKKPYRYGGGHGLWQDSAYDCSGSVSYALRGGNLLGQPRASGGFFGYGKPGKGKWVTIYTKAGHMYMVVAGLRFDTSGRDATGSRWQRAVRPTGGFVARHPKGL